MFKLAALFFLLIAQPSFAKEPKKALQPKSIEELTESQTLRASETNLSPHSLKSQPSAVTPSSTTQCHSVWGRTLPLPGSSKGRDIAISTVTGNVCAIGSVNTSIQGKDIVIACYDPCGRLLAMTTVNQPFNGDDLGYGIAIQSSSNIFVTGTVQEGPVNQNIWVAKYLLNSAGLIFNWGANIGGTAEDDQGREIALDSSGNVYVVGFKTVGGINGFKRIWLGRFMANTSQLEAQIYFSASDAGGTGHAEGTGLAVDSANGKVYATGFVKNATEGKNIWVGRFSLTLNPDPTFGFPVTPYFKSTYFTFNWGPAVDGDLGKAMAIAANPANPGMPVYAVGQGHPEGSSQFGLWVGISSFTVNYGQMSTLISPYDIASVNVKGEDVTIGPGPAGPVYIIGTVGVSNPNIWVRRYIPTTTFFVWTKTVDSGTASDAGYGIAIKDDALYITGVYNNKFLVKKCLTATGC